MRKTAISVSLLSPWLCPIPRHLSNASPTMSRRHTLWVWRGFLVRRRGLNSFAGGGSISDSWQKQQHISWSYKPYIKTTTSQGPMLCIYGYYQYHIYIYIYPYCKQGYTHVRTWFLSGGEAVPDSSRWFTWSGNPTHIILWCRKSSVTDDKNICLSYICFIINPTLLFTL